VNLLFDLDGTLTDPREGIELSFRHALAALGREAPPDEDFRRFIGPPLPESFAALLATGDEERLAEGVRLYRERYADRGLFENAVYPDIPAGLASLRRDGHRLWVATSKPIVFARRIIDHFDLGGWFEGIHGAELSGLRAGKAEVIAHLLETEGVDPESAWMIGDRVHDVEGARRNGLGAVAVSWGYGTPEELAAARPDAIVATMAELVAFLGRPPRRTE
jgi:phosphoglycolate phosphatase